MSFTILTGLNCENFYYVDTEIVSLHNMNFSTVFIAVSSPTIVCREVNTITAAAHLLFSTVSCSSCLHPLSSVLLWCRPSHTVPFRPRTRRSLLATLVALLLLSGDIQPNPGPPATATDYVTLGSLNIRSVTTKAALVHDIIQDNSIQILALQETWLPSDSHPAIKQDAAPPGFVVHHVHRPIVAGGPSRGGGLAVISSEHIKVRPRDLHFTPSTFELQSVSVHTSPPVLLLNIYQPNSPPPSAFFAELDTLLTNIAAESSSPLVLCGDLNCPGANGQSVNDHLDDVLTSCGLHQFVKQPTRGPNLLDVVASSDPHLVPEVRVIDCCEVTDHRLVTAKIRARRPRPPPLEFTYRDLKRLNLADFEASIRRSELFTSPACTADLFAEQLRSVVTAVLDKFVPLKTVKKRAQKSSSKWLSTEAVSAKRDRRRLERIWHKSRSEPDRCAYRVACRRANRLINQSRSDFIRSEIDSCVDLKQRWSTIKNCSIPRTQKNCLTTLTLHCVINSLTFLHLKLFNYVTTFYLAWPPTYLLNLSLCLLSLFTLVQLYKHFHRSPLKKLQKYFLVFALNPRPWTTYQLPSLNPVLMSSPY